MVLCPSVPAMNADEVRATVNAARIAQEAWCKTTFNQRREVLLTLLDFVVDNQEAICQVACRDTGKTSNLFIFLATG